jgi:AI-2 transport protein TqsA
MPALDPVLARPIWWTSFLLGAALVGSILIFGSRFLIPLAIAFMLWLLINAIGKLYARLEVGGFRLPRTLCRLLAILTMAGLFWLIVDITTRNVAQVRDAAPIYQANLVDLIERTSAFFNIERPVVDELIGRIDFANVVFSITTALGALIGNVGLIALYVAFMLLEQRNIDQKIDRLFDDQRQSAALRQSLDEIEDRIERYIWVKTVVSLVTAVLCWAVLARAGVNYPSLWALVIFLFNYVPNIGSLFAVILPALLTLLQFNDWGVFFSVTISLTLIQAVIGNYVEPRLMGTTLNLSPLVIILSLTFWGGIWGVAGMFLSVPITVILAIVFSKFEPTRPVAVLLSSRGEVPHKPVIDDEPPAAGEGGGADRDRTGDL